MNTLPDALAKGDTQTRQDYLSATETGERLCPSVNCTPEITVLSGEDPRPYGAVLCLDLGTQTGWALSSKERLITSGTISFKQDRWQGGGMRYLKFTHFLTQVNTQAGPIQMIFFEEVRRHLGVDAAHVYGGFLAHLTAWCEHHQIAYEGVPVGTIKRHATGKGNASKTQIMTAMQQRGHQPVDDNEADALALLYWAIEHHLGG